MFQNRFVTILLLGITAVGFINVAESAKPAKKPGGKTEEAPGKLTVDDMAGLVADNDTPSGNVYVHHQVNGSHDCVLLVVPARDGVNQGGVHFFLRLPGNLECEADDLQELERSLSVHTSSFDLNGEPEEDPSNGIEEGLIGRLDCSRIFIDDPSGANCIYTISLDWYIEWATLLVTFETEDIVSVKSVENFEGNDAEVFRTEEVASKGKKTKTAPVSQGMVKIPLDITFERNPTLPTP